MGKLIELRCLNCSAPLKLGKNSTAKCSHCGTDHTMIDNGEKNTGMVSVSYFPTSDKKGKTIVPLKLQIIKFLREKYPQYYIADFNSNDLDSDDRFEAEVTLVDGKIVINYTYYATNDDDPICVQEIGTRKEDRYEVVGSGFFGDRYDWVLCDVPDGTKMLDIHIEDVTNDGYVIGQRVSISVCDEEYVDFADMLVRDIHEKFGVMPDSYLVKL